MVPGEPEMVFLEQGTLYVHVADLKRRVEKVSDLEVNPWPTKPRQS